MTLAIRSVIDFTSTSDTSHANKNCDENDKAIESYKVDPVTGQGTDWAGETVNLPQTGNNAPAAAAAVSGAALLLLAGTVMMLRSGILRRRQDEENA